MDQFQLIEQDPFLTCFLAPNASTQYTVESRRHPEGWWSSSIYGTGKDDENRVELARVTYFAPGSTRVTFGARAVELDTFLTRRSVTSNSRVFVGPNGESYKWRIKGQNLELFDLRSGNLVARSRCSRINFFSGKVRPASLEVVRKRVDATTLDAVVVTFVIMDHLLKERFHYMYPW